MSEVVRLTLVSHAMTDAMAACRFPADEPLNALGIKQVELEGGAFDRVDTAVTAPEARTLQTAELLGLPAQVDQRLTDLDFGRWRGEVLGNVPPVELSRWLSQPSAAPHGGESVAGLIDRVRDWLASTSLRPGKLVAVTHPAVVRAAILIALDAPPKSFWRLDIAPASRSVLHFREQGWTVRSFSGQPCGQR